jgi:SAM-dependent methyltransferase
LTVVDLGCGDGYLIPALAAEFNDHVFGVEPSPVFRGIATRRNPSHGAWTYLDGSAEHIPLEVDHCDVVLMRRVLYPDNVPVQDLPQAAAEIARVLRPGGRVVIHNIFSDDISDSVEADDYFSVDHVVARFASAGLTRLTLDIPQPWQPSEDLAGKPLPPNYGYTDEDQQQALANVDEEVEAERTFAFELVDATTEDGHP